MSVLELYLETTGVDTTSANTSLMLGGAFSGYYLMRGSLDEVRLFDRALTAEEVQLVMNPPANNVGGSTGLTPTDGLAYQYDLNGNRTGFNDLVSGSSSGYGYETNSNRLSSVNATNIQLDANVSYQYNALGQRAAKDVSGSVTSFAYGLGGELLGEYEAGVVQAEHIYLGGQPLAVIQDGNVYYIHSDHLGTPRVISDQNQTAVWQWESDPFGGTTANDDVDGDGVAFVYNKRFAGQYYDSETGLHYNYFRYYDPSTGRYITSDPIGLRGGLNTYGYVGGNPANWSDPLGLVVWKGQFYSVGASVGLGAYTHWIFTLTSECIDGQKYKIKVSADVFGAEYSLPFGTTGGDISIDDGLGVIDPSGFEGTILIGGSSVAWGIGYSWTFISFNDGLITYNGHGVIGGVDVALFSEAFGESEVSILDKSKCSSCDKGE